ncbi:MAG TPA: ribose 5-phosphate isomerase B [Myxococcota bacterium]|nr:ribose 5-phosphate isomerase B [Myxococcota bacterium]
MKIALAADHAGFALKEKLVAELRRLGHVSEDFGTSGTESCDYPDFAIPAVQSVAEAKNERAILCCTNGIGMSMIANRMPGIRGALVYSARSAAMTRQHHDSNVLCLGAGEFPAETLLEWVRIWLSTDFEGGRHARRIGKVTALERK